jgi:hypothetical protein
VRRIQKPLRTPHPARFQNFFIQENYFMDFLTGLAYFLIVWGAATLGLAIFRWDFLWKIGKVQGFVQLLGEKGTSIFFGIAGGAAIVGGVLILV